MVVFVFINLSGRGGLVLLIEWCFSFYGLVWFESIWLDVVLLVVSLAFLAFFSMRFIRVLNTLSLYGGCLCFAVVYCIGFTSLPDLFIAGFSSVQGQLPLVVR